MSACLVTGSEKQRCGYGNGDCLFIDYHHHVIAVADATERCPTASRWLIQNFHNNLQRISFSDDPEQFGHCVQEAYAHQAYEHKTTFCAVALIPSKSHEIILGVAHGGDSTLMLVNWTDGTIMYQTRSNMNFAGRSKTCTHVFPLTLNDLSTRIILTTDGFSDVIRHINHQNYSSPTGLNGKLIDELLFTSVDHTALFISEYISTHQHHMEYDDLACIIVDPFQFMTLQSQSYVILGGTSPQEEHSQ